MEKIKHFLAEKSYGFYVTVALMILTLITTIVYTVSYGKFVSYMSWNAVIFMYVGLGLSVLLVVFKLDKWAPLPLAISSLLGFLLFIRYIYGYVVVVLVGIDLHSFSSQFILCSTLFALLLIGNIANIFFKQVKGVK